MRHTPSDTGGVDGARQLASASWSACRSAFRAAAGWLAGFVVVTIVAAALPVASVWLLKDVIDTLAGPAGGFPASAAALVAVGLATGVLPSMTTYVRNQSARLIGRRSQSDLYMALSRLAGLARSEDPVFRDRLRMAQLTGRSGPAQVVEGLVSIVQSVITLAGLVTVLAVISPAAAAFALAGGIPALVAQIKLSKARARMFWLISPVERREMFYTELQTSLAAAKELRLLGLFDLFRGRMLDELAVADRERRRMDGRELRLQFGLGLLSAVVSCGGLVWAINAAASGPVAGRLSVGEVSAFVAAMAGLLAGIAGLVGQVAAVHHSLLMYAHFAMLLSVEPDLELAADPAPVPPLRRGIELRDVWFRYQPDQDWILRGVDLFVPHGKAVALVGLNGAGKSTLVKLLCRFYDPERGSVLWDGKDLRDLSVTELRERIGAVFQDYMHYDLTAAENIGLGDVSRLDDPDRIRAAAETAGIHRTVDELPRGYQTMLSRMFATMLPSSGDGPADDDNEDGVLLSGGQWQRLALARAFMRDRRDLLILDEPSSGLDAAAEHEIHHGLRRHRAGATSVLISHRLGAIRDADQIVVLSGGRVTEQGTHDTLLALDGEYARLFTMQAEGYAPVADTSPAEAAAPLNGVRR